MFDEECVAILNQLTTALYPHDKNQLLLFTIKKSDVIPDETHEKCKYHFYLIFQTLFWFSYVLRSSS